MDANVEKIAQFPALCDALLHFSHRIAAYVSNTASGLRISRNRRNRDSGPCGADAGRREKRGGRIVPEYDPSAPPEGCAAGAPQAAESESAFDIPDKRPGPPASWSQRPFRGRRPSAGEASFSSSTMARIEAFIVDDEKVDYELMDALREMDAATRMQGRGVLLNMESGF